MSSLSYGLWGRVRVASEIVRPFLSLPPSSARMAAALAAALRTLEALGFEELGKVRAEDVDTAAFGLAQYAEAHLGRLLPVSAEQPVKVAKQVGRPPT